MIKLFIGGFPLEIEEIELAKLFALHGDISTVKIVRDKKTRICKGYAFIEMTDRKGAEAAAEALNGTSFKGKVLSVKINEETIAYSEPVNPASFPIPTSFYKKVEKPNGEQKKKRPRKML